jgi:hypothetical protein
VGGAKVAGSGRGHDRDPTARPGGSGGRTSRTQLGRRPRRGPRSPEGFDARRRTREPHESYSPTSPVPPAAAGARGSRGSLDSTSRGPQYLQVRFIAQASLRGKSHGRGLPTGRARSRSAAPPTKA